MTLTKEKRESMWSKAATRFLGRGKASFAAVISRNSVMGFPQICGRSVANGNREWLR